MIGPDQRTLMAQQVAAMSPAERLLLLYERLVADLDMAADAMEASDHEGTNTALVSAQGILVALGTVLDPSWEGAARLDALYRWCWETLVQANVTTDPGRLEDVAGIISQLHAAWRQAAAAPVPA